MLELYHGGLTQASVKVRLTDPALIQRVRAAQRE